MNLTRRWKLENVESMQRTQARYETLSTDAQSLEKLAHLQAFIEQLARTPNGKADLAGRTRALGQCLRTAGESNCRYYGRLRRWLDTDLKDLAEEAEPCDDTRTDHRSPAR